LNEPFITSIMGIFKISYFVIHLRKFKRANFFKVYLTNPSTRSALFSPIKSNNEFIGNMVETAIYSQWKHSYKSKLFYARWKTGEVDIVRLNNEGSPVWCVEIKWSDKCIDDEFQLKNIISFCKKHNIAIVYCTTLDRHVVKRSDNLDFKFLPSALYCYTIGKNRVKHSD